MRFWRAIPVRPYGGCSLVPLILSYQPADDPIAIGLSFATCNGPASWWVSRDVVRDGLTPDRVPIFAYHDAARVHLSLLPFTGLALLTLRLDSGAGWPSLTVHCAELADFLAVTYQICPPEDEARIVADELATQISFMQMTDPRGGNPA